MPVLYIVNDDVAARIRTWAAKEGEGGWQNLCAEIERGRHDSFASVLRTARVAGIDAAVQNLEALKAVEEARDD